MPVRTLVTEFLEHRLPRKVIGCPDDFQHGLFKVREKCDGIVFSKGDLLFYLSYLL